MTKALKPFFFILLIGFFIQSGLYAVEEQNPLLSSWETYLRMKSASPFNLEWISIGPVFNSARVEAVQCDPATGTMYTAFGSGNLWKSVNGGLSWTPLFENQPALGIGDIALSPSNPEVIWLGSGESLKKARNFTMPGTGVYRSTDGGRTWAHLGLNDSYHIGEIAVHPSDPDTAVVAVLGHFWSTNPNRGLYRTDDGGQTWTHVLYVNERTGANDVVFSPSNPEILYASMWENNPGIFGPESGVYKSEDGGLSWKRLHGGLPNGPQTGRIGLAVSWSNPDKAYALIDNLNKDKNKAAEVYRTNDGGLTWKRTHSEDLLIFPGIGWYFTDCYVNPKNDDEVFALGVRAARSTDGGRTFSLIGGDVFHLFPNPAEVLHLDHCEMWINPLDPDHLILGNDGGLFISRDLGQSWLHCNNIPAGEFYDISVDNDHPYRVYGGTQDDSSVYGPAREWQPEFPDGWNYVWLDAWAGGDGCFTMPDPEDSNTVYFSAQNRAVSRKDMKADRSISIRPRFPGGHKGRMAYTFVTPYIISPHNHLTLYHAGNYVFKSLNRGDDWRLISPDLSESSLPEKKGGAVGAIAESRLQPGLLYAGTDHGAFWVSQNDGVQWSERSAGLPDEYIRSICPSRYAEGRVYVAVTGINHDDLNNYLFVSEDHGSTWTSLRGNLPNEVANVILEDPANENILYAGLYRGVYLSVDRGKSWALLGPGLPAACISDLVIQEREMDLVAGTHGRGIYKMNIRPIQDAFKMGPPDTNKLFVPSTARLPQFGDTHREPIRKTMGKVPLSFYLIKKQPVTLEVIDTRGQFVWRQELEGKKGLNQYRWDLVTKKTDSPQPYFIHFLQFPKPGTYTVHLTLESGVIKKPLEILPYRSPKRP